MNKQKHSICIIYRDNKYDQLKRLMRIKKAINLYLANFLKNLKIYEES